MTLRLNAGLSGNDPATMSTTWVRLAGEGNVLVVVVGGGSDFFASLEHAAEREDHQGDRDQASDHDAEGTSRK